MLNFIAYLTAQVNKAIYVWGGQGQNLTEMEHPDTWIKNREPSAYNADRAIALYNKRVEAGISPILAFDCSGLIMYYLQNLMGVFKYDMTAQGLYYKCAYHPTVQELQAGDLVFKGTDAANITHVGVYVGGGKVIESKGRDYGVVEREFADGDWVFYGHLAELEPFLPHEVHPDYLTVTKPMSKGDEYKAAQELLLAAGFTDYNGDPVEADGKWGNKSRSAFEKMIKYYGGIK